MPNTTSPRYALWTTASIPLLILTGFGLLTTVPVAVMAIASLRDDRLAAVRSRIALTVGLFAGPFVTWLFRADPTASLTSLLHPAMAIAIALSATATLFGMFRHRRHKLG